MQTWHVRHPDYLVAVQFLTQKNVTIADVLFDCVAILGDVPPTSIALGKPENIVWSQA